MGIPSESPEAFWRQRARRFGEERIAPVAAAMDRDDRMPPELRPALAAAGFLGVGLPEEWGGR
ncbi:MAG TPA: acyl-CoA dehydrogenase family protein, partial [Thermoplasmata archaeon]|nr:acyl-CoA dehydrogenase family protein [Thermoplasmata archaeon]